MQGGLDIYKSRDNPIVTNRYCCDNRVHYLVSTSLWMDGSLLDLEYCCTFVGFRSSPVTATTVMGRKIDNCQICLGIHDNTGVQIFVDLETIQQLSIVTAAVVTVMDPFPHLYAIYLEHKFAYFLWIKFLYFIIIYDKFI